MNNPLKHWKLNPVNQQAHNRCGINLLFINNKCLAVRIRDFRLRLSLIVTIKKSTNRIDLICTFKNWL